MHEDLASAARAMAAQAGTDNRNVAGMMRIILNHHAVDLARIVLARWGTPAIKPVPVSLRLPGEGDCDPEGMCWWFSPEDAGVGQFGVAACWVLRQRGKDDDWLQAWLPHYALPVPSSIHD